MGTYERSRGTSPLILNLGNRRRLVFILTFQPIYYRKQSGLYPLIRNLGGLQNRPGKVGNETTFLSSYVGLLARSQYSEVPATGHLDTGFSCFPCVYKQTLRWLPTFQVATTCFLSFSPPDLNLLVTHFIFCIHVK